MKFYCNPIKKQEDIADPFVLRHNGRYYLYCTSPDIRCWHSDNLIDWEFAGPTISSDTFPSLVPFAPEVVYWNGAFYMYTSPHGLGHYVLKSDSPTGPFLKLTGNVAHSIDGSVFIDDDGKWYFYWADEHGILGCEMKSPVEFGEPIQTGAFMHGWTEGPMVVKENGMYFMTYTGNHYLSKGYRINAAISAHPLSGYIDCDDNPVIVHTEEPFVGLGHSSTVYGPDMLTRYIIYHNLNSDRTRDLNIDIVLLEDSMRILGPTSFPQPFPKLPDFSDDMIANKSASNWQLLNGNWVVNDSFRVSNGAFKCQCKRTLGSDVGVIEFNLSVKAGEGCYGIQIGDYRIVLDTASTAVQLIGTNDSVMHVCIIPYAYEHDALHCLQIRHTATGTRLYLDGRMTAEYDIRLRIGDKIGCFSEGPHIAMGYTAFNAGDAQTAEEKLFVPVPCRIPLNGKKSEKLNVNVPQTGEYFFAVDCQEVINAQSALFTTADSTFAQTRLLATSSDVAVYSLRLPQGLNDVGINLGNGLINPSAISLNQSAGEPHISQEITNFGLYDKRCWGDMELPCFETELILDSSPVSENSSAGIIFRASELSDGGEGDDKQLGINFFIGYCVALEHDQVVLTKHRYNEKRLISRKLDSSAGIRRLCVRVNVNDISVYVNNCEAPVLEYHDPAPLLFGRTGVRVKNFEIDFAEFHRF
jgi:hypothetical protein